ncbi:hypothetical protein H4F99_02425 [Lysobacter sp. SG-8]|uniref:Uncharacterized protein n=1 Tax=Marilutibacter penaei TaxID=2759900 RepID=A0A7W3U1P4_9GAMM|nr:hypothetical protein [Lysobacter penaei]MBB1087341.1 hypothetical protein [Lysobacter penaei]
MPVRSGRSVLRSAWLAILLLVVGVAIASPSNKWRLEVSSDADSDGEVVVRISPVGGTAIDVRIAIPDDTSENHIADLISNGLKAELGDMYHVEVDDGEDVLIKKHHDGADFEVAIVELTVEGTHIHIDRE